MIIALEGMDASGKATHAKKLAEKLNGVVIDFPHYSTKVGHLIEGHLKNWWSTERGNQADINLMSTSDFDKWLETEGTLDAMVFQCLQTINRLELLETINNHINNGKTIIFDRYWASALVYGALDGLDTTWIRDIQAPLPEPDLWLFLDIPAEESVRRRPDRRDRYEKKPGFMEKVRQEYLSLFEKERGAELKRRAAELPMGPGWYIINGLGTLDEVESNIWEAIKTEMHAIHSRGNY